MARMQSSKQSARSMKGPLFSWAARVPHKKLCTNRLTDPWICGLLYFHTEDEKFKHPISTPLRGGTPRRNPLAHQGEGVRCDRRNRRAVCRVGNDRAPRALQAGRSGPHYQDTWGSDGGSFRIYGADVSRALG